MYEMIQPHLTEIMQAIVSIFLLFVMAILAIVRKRVEKWLDTHTSKEQREILHRLAEEAYSYAEDIYKQENGSVKLNEAMEYALLKVNRYGFDFSEEDIRGAVQKAWQDFEGREKKKK